MMNVSEQSATDHQVPAYITEIAEWLSKEGVDQKPEAAVILGSGLGGFADRITPIHRWNYDTIPHFPNTSVVGHAGELIFGSISKQGKNYPILAFAGRFHHYEGHSMDRTVIPVQLAQALRAKKLIISNAAGGINYRFQVGDLMLINDVMHTGVHMSTFGTKRFTVDHYDIIDRAQQLAFEQGIRVQRGTYMYAKGPNYETKAEIRAFRRMGADAVGMSTAPEWTEAQRLGLPVIAVSIISNMAAGVVKGTLDHDEVKAAADSRKEDFANLVNTFIANL
ncbi:MAG: purine-nucleoside phosphorylase [Bacteroidota bacterium]